MALKCNYPRTTIAVDGVPWDVSSEPVRVRGMSDNFLTTRVSLTSDAFVLTTASVVVLFGFFILGFGIFVLSLLVKGYLDGVLVVPQNLDFWEAVETIAGIAFALFIGVVAIVMTLTYMTRSTRFDRSTGMMTRRALFRTWSELPLTTIVAVQCLYTGQGTGRGAAYDILQLNLVVVTGNAPRICLTSNPNEKWVRETAMDLASFLGVQVVDQIAESKSVYEANRFKSWW